jgi:hypothetical protein
MKAAMRRWAVGLAAVGTTVGLLAATGGAAQAAAAKRAPAARAGAHSTATKHVGSFGAVDGITNGNLLSYSVQSATFTSPSGSQVGGSVFCPTGTHVMGGGVFISGSDLSDNVNTSEPNGTTAWTGFVNNSSGFSTSFTVSAECAKAPKGYHIVASTATDNPAGSQTTNILAECPVGDRVLGGGGRLSSFDPNVAINSSLPEKIKVGTVQRYFWRVDANNASASDDTATAFAVCGKKISGYHLVTGTSVTNAAFTETPAGVGCPVVNSLQTLAMGGGVFSSSGSTLTSINSTAPSSSSGTGWQDFENNGSSSSSSITPYVVCAL